MSFKIDRLKKNRLILLVGSIAFLFNGWDSLDSNNYFLAACNFCLALANLVSLYFINGKPRKVNLILFVLNSVLAFVIAFNYFENGKKVLPWAWTIVVFHI